MPVDYAKTQEQFERYVYARDNGHIDYITKDKKCNEFMKGHQWDAATEARLLRQKRPNLTINKVFANVITAMGEQLNNRVDVSFKPVDDTSDDAKAAILDKVYLHEMRRNQYDYIESDVFAYGIVGSRAYFDVRADFSDNFKADVEISRVHGRNVVIDADATDYDPDTWKEVFVSKWITINDIASTYSEADAKYLQERADRGEFRYAYDSVDDYNPGSLGKGKTGLPANIRYTDDLSNKIRRVRVIERQFRSVERVWHLVDLMTGDKSVVPANWPKSKMERVAKLTGTRLVKMKSEVIRWRVTADDVLLHDAVSPYKHFTIIPYFPVLHDGETMGIVEHLLSVQEQLNKTESQILHIVNTTSNSGWKTKRGNVKNMTLEELELRGAETGLVIEVEDPSMTEKIQPNQVPTGLDLVSRKADEYIKEISGFSDSSRGFDRADVAAKAIQYKQQAGQSNTAKYFDNLNRSRFFVARAVLSIVQEFYTEERIFRITGNSLGSTSETFTVNQVTPEGEVLNDLTVGKYDIVISTVPARDTFDQTQLQEAIQLRELGVPIADSVLIRHSTLSDKNEILEQMNSGPSEEEQRAMDLEFAEKEAEIRMKNAQAAEKEADVMLKAVKAKAEMLRAQREERGEYDVPSEVDKESFERYARIRTMDQQDRAMDLQEQQMAKAAATVNSSKKPESNLSRLSS